MWKLWNALFGWDYVQWRNSCDHGVARVHTDGIGRAWYWRYKSVRCADRITDERDVLWLTCGPSKYMRVPPPGAERR